MPREIYHCPICGDPYVVSGKHSSCPTSMSHGGLRSPTEGITRRQYESYLAQKDVPVATKLPGGKELNMTQQTATAEEVREIIKRGRAQKRQSKRAAEKEVRAKPTKRKTSAQFYAGYLATPPAEMQSEAEQAEQRQLFERRDYAAVTIRLPLAPTANNLKSIRQLPGGKPFLVPSTQFNAYKKAVAYFWKKHYGGWAPEPLTGRLRVLIVVHQTRRGGDVANREKALCDALSECGAWGDDSQIDDLHMIRGDVIPVAGALDVTIETIEL